MHEMGIVVQLTRTLDEITKREKIKKIGKVTVQVGEVSGVVDQFFYECWGYVKTNYPALADSELVLEPMTAITFCENCQKTYETMKYGKTCPYCKSGETYLVSGRECIIKEIEAEVDKDYDVKINKDN